ncbi:MAG: ribonuclease J [Acidimicrobiales bacterium]
MAESVRISFLGGLGEIGRNCACIELEGRMLLLDCGVMFPGPDTPGIDLVLPDFSYLKQNADRIEGCVLTHGHEDHVGGLAFLLRDIPSLSIYGSELTLGLASNRISEAGMSGRARLVPVRDSERRSIGPFDVEFIPVTHSVPHGFATALHTPQGVVLHSGDFKLDLTPVDARTTDLARIGGIACDEGIRLLLSDSTNADQPGFTASESAIGEVLRALFERCVDRRILTTCFASHIHRIQQVINAAAASGRVVATLGRSMAKNLALATSLGVVQVPKGLLVDIDDIDDYEPGRVCVISTGSQGEPMSALSLLAAGQNRFLKVMPGDVVIVSAHAIPGNEWAVAKVIDGLCRLGAEVVYEGVDEVHASGHAKQGELKTLLSVAEPEWFIPVHGEYRHLVSHARLAQRMGVPAANAIVCEDGDSVVLDDDGLHQDGKVPAAYLFVDGIVGGVGHGVLRDRRTLAEEGVVMVVVTLDSQTGEILTGPEIETRGWVHAPEADELIDDLRRAAEGAIKALPGKHGAGPLEPEIVSRAVRTAVAKVVGERTRRRPMIVPVIMDA